MRNIASCTLKWFVILSVLSSCLVKCNLQDIIVAEDIETPVEVEDEESPVTTTLGAVATSIQQTSATTTVSPLATRPSTSDNDSSTVDLIEKILKDKPSNLKIIYELLRKVQANRCVYGPDPKLNDLCPDLMSVRSYADAIPNLNELRFSDVRARVIDESIVQRLIEECPIGEWCLDDVLLSARRRLVANNSTTTTTTTTSNSTATSSLLLATNQTTSSFLDDSKLFCLIESCFKNIEYYVDKCVKNNLTSHVVQLAPEFCNFDIENTQNEFCIENSLRLIHVSAAFFMLTEEVKAPTPDVCRNEVETNKCSKECQSMALSINKLTSCCGDTKLIKNFKSFNWYFDNFYQVKRSCQLPLKSICLSEGKYYLGISPTILVISILTSTCLTSFLATVVYFMCCRRRRGRHNNKVYYENSADLYEYAHLNPCVEDENISINPANLGDDEFALAMDDRYHRHQKPVSVSNMSMGGGSGGGAMADGSDEKLIFVDMNNNPNDDNNNNHANISRFVNQHQTDIRGLILND